MPKARQILKRNLPREPDRHGAFPLSVTRPELLKDGKDLKFRKFVQDVVAFSSRAEEGRSRLGALIGLTGIGYSILVALMYLERIERSIGINEIAGHVHLSGTFVTAEVNKLIVAGLVVKEPNPSDRRRVILTSTSEARRRLERVNEVLSPVNDVWFESLSESSFDELSRIMSNLAAASDHALKLMEFLAGKQKMSFKK